MHVSCFSYLSVLAMVCLFALGDAFAVESVEVLKSNQALSDSPDHQNLRDFSFYDIFVRWDRRMDGQNGVAHNTDDSSSDQSSKRNRQNLK